MQGFESAEFTPKVQALKEFEDDYGLKLDGDEEEEDDEDDEDDDEETGSEDEGDDE